MEEDQCDVDQLTAFLEEDDSKMTASPSGSCAKSAQAAEWPDVDSSDDDIDEDELDRLASIVEQDAARPICGNAKKTNDHQNGLKRTVNPKPQNTSSKPVTPPSQQPNEALANELKMMQERIKLLESQLSQQNVVKPEPTEKKAEGSQNKPTKVKQETTVKKAAASESKSTKNKNEKPRVLKEIQEDIFFGKSESPEEKKLSPKTDKNSSKKSNIPNSKELFGDSDSDWEDMDGDKPSNLNESGREINKLMKKGQRTAHASSYDRNEYREKPKTSWKEPPKTIEEKLKSRKEPIMPKGDGIVSSYSSQISAKDDANVARDPFSGIRIVNPLVSTVTLRNRMEGKKMVKMSKLCSRINSSDTAGDWVTIGVLISKTDPKTSAKGSQFSIWKMSDLEDCDKCISVFLFGEVHKHHWKTIPGSVFGLLNASQMKNADKYPQNKDDVAITVDHPQKLMPFGRSKDYGVCKARTQQGKDCLNFINKEQGEYCSYHVQKAYKKTSAKRSELQASFTGIAPKSFEKKLFPKKHATVCYGGQTFTQNSAKPKKQVSIGSLQYHQVSTKPGKVMKKSTLTIHELLPEDAKTLQKIKEKKPKELKEDTEAFHEILSVPTRGSLNLVKHLVKTENIDKDKKIISKGGTIQSVSASSLLKSYKKEWTQQGKIGTKHAGSPSLGGLPKLGKGFQPGQDIFFDAPSKPSSKGNKHLEAAKKMAIAKISSKGGIKKENPNAVKKERSPEAREKFKRKLEETLNDSIDSESENSNVDEKPRKKSRLLGGLDLEDPEVQKLLKKKSKHASALTEIESEKQEQYFNALEAKEKMEDKMSQITKVKCVVFSCRVCKYTAFSPKDSCKKEGHNVIKSDAFKRFFKCKSCNTRVTSIDRYPKATCRKCGGSTYEKTGMMKEKSGPKLASEELLLRGEECKNLNSLQ